MLRAVISLGTNTVRLLVVRDGADGVEIVEHLQTGTRLGEGLGASGALMPEAVERTLGVVASFAARAREHRAALCGIATSAVRRASDRDAFAARFAAVAGVELAVLPGETEALASYRGATYGAPRDGSRTAVLDIGGGSTECAVGRDGVLEGAVSVEIGSVRVGERFPRLLGSAPGAPAREEATLARAAIDEALAPLRALGPVDRVRAVAGTPLTLAAVAFESHVDRVSGRAFDLATIEATLARLFDATLDERRALPGMLAQRADIVAGGGLILTQALRLLGAREAQLESNDLLLGYLLLTSEAGPSE